MPRAAAWPASAARTARTSARCRPSSPAASCSGLGRRRPTRCFRRSDPSHAGAGPHHDVLPAARAPGHAVCAAAATVAAVAGHDDVARVRLGVPAAGPVAGRGVPGGGGVAGGLAVAGAEPPSTQDFVDCLDDFEARQSAADNASEDDGDLTQPYVPPSSAAFELRPAPAGHLCPHGNGPGCAACAARQRGDVVVAAPAPRRRSLACRDVNDRDVNAAPPPVVAKAAPPAPAPPPRPAEPPAPAEPVAPPAPSSCRLAAATRRAARASRAAAPADDAWAPHRKAATEGGFYEVCPDFDAQLQFALDNAQEGDLDGMEAAAAATTDARERAVYAYIVAAVRALAVPAEPAAPAAPPLPVEPPARARRAAGTAARRSRRGSAGARAAVAAAGVRHLPRGDRRRRPGPPVRPHLPLGMHRRAGGPCAHGGADAAVAPGVLPALPQRGARAGARSKGRRGRPHLPPAQGAEEKRRRAPKPPPEPPGAKKKRAHEKIAPYRNDFWAHLNGAIEKKKSQKPRKKKNRTSSRARPSSTSRRGRRRHRARRRPPTRRRRRRRRRR